MATDTVKSTAVTNADATPIVLNNARNARGLLFEVVGTGEATAAADIGSTYRLARVNSSDRISQVLISCDAAGATGAADIGVYQTAANGGAVVDADFFGSAVVLTAALSDSDVTHESGVFGIEDVEKPLWEALGETADPMIEYDIALTLTAAHANGGTLTLKVRGAQ